MALLRMKEIREMTADARDVKLKDLRDELLHERGQAAMGGAPHSPGQIRALRKNIARILTVLTQERSAKPVAKPAAPPAKPKPAAKAKAKGARPKARKKGGASA
ncbi:MAG TPA: 50S ribosomal protein L29 [Thermoplasmata archaeon]|jgi:large subunit ribosomal protein L29|nr:50S ribosomal protein L29 [Thermoplasmata archaeon]